MDSQATRYQQDFSVSQKGLDVRQCMLMVQKQGGKSLGGQLGDIVRLARGDGKLQPSDYYYFRLYDDEAFPYEAKRRFLSDRIHYNIIRRCCDEHWWAAADDKFLAYSLLESCGAAVPETQAIFSASSRRFGRIPTLATAGEVAGFLRTDADYPLFAKPLAGVGSFGASLIEALDGETLKLAGGDTMSVSDFIAGLDVEQGYLFQDVLVPHPDLGKYGTTASTVRVIVIIDNGVPEILHTIWKIPGKGNIADNFWRKGNMLAAVDHRTGTIQRVVRGVGPMMETVTDHPDTGAALVGETLPDWQKMIDMVTDNARVFAPIRYQSWDIALCEQGPVVVEVNTGSAFNLSQLAKGEGFLTDRYRDFLQSCGWKLKTRH